MNEDEIYQWYHKRVNFPHGLVEISNDADYQARVTDPTKAHLVMMEIRPGVISFLAALENYWYRPGTKQANLFTLHNINWQELDWYIASFPLTRLPAVRVLANLLKLRLGNGVPTIIKSASEADSESVPHPRIPGMVANFFPGSKMPDGKDNMNMLTVEYLSGAHPLGGGSGTAVFSGPEAQAVRQREAEINYLLNHKRMHIIPQHIFDYIYGKMPAKPDWQAGIAEAIAEQQKWQQEK